MQLGELEPCRRVDDKDCCDRGGKAELKAHL